MATPIETYIRQAAMARGIDPDIAVRVANAEGGMNDPTRQSLATKNGIREPSYGPFQLLVGGEGTGYPSGLGNRAVAAGVDPRNPDHWQQGVDFALDEVNRRGWGQWYGAKHAGVQNWDGVGKRSTMSPEQMRPPGVLSGVGSPNEFPEQSQTSASGIPQKPKGILGLLPRQVAQAIEGPDGKPTMLGGILSGVAKGLANMESAPTGHLGGSKFGGDARQGADQLLKALTSAPVSGILSRGRVKPNVRNFWS